MKSENIGSMNFYHYLKKTGLTWSTYARDQSEVWRIEKELVTAGDYL